MRRNVYSSAVFAGVPPLCTQILPGHGRPPPTILGIRKLETPDGEKRIPLRSLVLTQYRNVTDRQTDRRTDLFAVGFTALAKLALRSAVKTYKAPLTGAQLRRTE